MNLCFGGDDGAGSKEGKRDQWRLKGNFWPLRVLMPQVGWALARRMPKALHRQTAQRQTINRESFIYRQMVCHILLSSDCPLVNIHF